MAETFLEVAGLKTHFPVERGVILRRRVGLVKAVDGVSFSLARGEILGLSGLEGQGQGDLLFALFTTSHKTRLSPTADPPGGIMYFAA